MSENKIPIMQIMFINTLKRVEEIDLKDNVITLNDPNFIPDFWTDKYNWYCLGAHDFLVDNALRDLENTNLKQEKENFMDFIKENKLTEQWQEWNSHK